MPLSAVDFEFVSFGDDKRFGSYAHQVGVSNSSQNMYRQFNIGGQAKEDLLGTFMDLVHASPADRAAAIGTARNSLSVASHTPGAQIWNKALDAFEPIQKGSSAMGQIGTLVDTLHSDLSAMQDQLTPGMLNFGEGQVVGSNFTGADLPYLKQYANYDRSKVSNLANVGNPSPPMQRFMNEFMSEGLEPHTAFEQWARPQVDQALHEAGYSHRQINQVQWGKGGPSRGFYGLEDLFHLTGGKEAHADFIVDAMKKAGHTINPEDIGGVHGIGKEAHGALYDAVVTESVHRRMQQLSGNIPAGDPGIQPNRIIEARINNAMTMLGDPEPNPAKEVVEEMATTTGPATRNHGRKATHRGQEAFGRIMSTFQKSDVYKSVQKSAVGRRMKGKWGTVAALGAAAAVVGGIGQESSARRRRSKMPANYISTDRLSHALALGGPF